MRFFAAKEVRTFLDDKATCASIGKAVAKRGGLPEFLD